MKKTLTGSVFTYALAGILLIMLGERVVDRSMSRSPAARSAGCASAQNEIHGAAARTHSCADCANARHRVTDAVEYNPQESSMDPDVDPEDLNQLKSLGIWIAGKTLDEGELAEGLVIARKRDPNVRKLIREYPDLVYQHALGQDAWDRLPEELKPLVERKFHGNGSYQVARDCESDNVWRNLTMDDFSTATSAVSPRLANVDSFSGMMKGVVLGNDAGLVAFEGESLAPAQAASAEPPISAASSHQIQFGL